MPSTARANPRDVDGAGHRLVTGGVEVQMIQSFKAWRLASPSGVQ
jgi:hypothetical protein